MTDDEASLVRPYTVTGGRTRSAASAALAFEALVEALGPIEACRQPEGRQILAATEHEYLSVAELSAHLHLPIGVVRVLVGDLLEAALVRVHGPRAARGDSAAADRAGTLRVLESVLDGIRAL